MGENARSRRRLIALGVLGYGLVFAGLCLLQAPAIAIAAYFVIPTALVAIAGGPIAGAGAAMFSMLLFLVAAAIGAGTTESTGPASSTTGVSSPGRRRGPRSCAPSRSLRTKPVLAT
jgi:hypothetical protein